MKNFKKHDCSYNLKKKTKNKTKIFLKIKLIPQTDI